MSKWGPSLHAWESAGSSPNGSNQMKEGCGLAVRQCDFMSLGKGDRITLG